MYDAPTRCSRKSVILDWLREEVTTFQKKNIPKVLLYQTVKENKDKYSEYKDIF